jgi:hypothetical protein
MANEKIVIGIDNQVIELKGEQLEAFIAQREHDKAEDLKAKKLIEDEQSRINALKESALAKLAALGLTEEEIAAL